MKRFLTLLLGVCLISSGACRDRASHRGNQLPHDRKLFQSLDLATKSSDTIAIFPGDTNSKKFLLDGWDAPKQKDAPFAVIAAQKAGIVFQPGQIQDLYLHLKIQGYFPASIDLRLNSQPLHTLNLSKDEQEVIVPVPASLLLPKTNVLEFIPSTLQSVDYVAQKPVAAGVYHAIISPAKHAPEQITAQAAAEYFEVKDIRVKQKPHKEIAFRTGGTLSFIEKLNSRANLRFGIRYDAPALAENDDFAEFHILLKQDGKKPVRIFEQKAVEDKTSFHSVDLARFGVKTKEQPEVFELEFRIRRNSIYSAAVASWIDPTLESTDARSNPPTNRSAEALREIHKNSNVLIIVLDAASADHFGAYGYKRNTTPVFDGLSKEGVLFDRAYTQAVYTLASTASLMSGMFPRTHRIISTKNKLPATTWTMAEMFKNAGYRTGTFVANGNASTTFGMTQGFDEKGEVFRDANYTGWGQDVTNSFTKWISRKPEQKFFAYMHFREPHAPFNPPEKWIDKYTDPDYQGIKDASFEMRQKITMGAVQATQADRDYIIALYDANLNYGDYQVSLVLQKLRDLNIYDNTIVIVTSDHGEAFWEHGFQGHNVQLYEESIRIPFVMRLRNRLSMRVSHPVRTIDVYPTLADLLRLSRKHVRTDGQSFVPYLLGAPRDEREVITQTVGDRGYSYTDKDYKYIIYPGYRTEELYNLIKDPKEKVNLVEQEPIRAAFYRSRLNHWLAANKRYQDWQKTEKPVIDESAKENLEALGYTTE